MKALLLAALVLATAPLYANYTPFYLALLTEVLVFGLFALAYDVLADVIIYLAMAVVLLVRPRGLFGEEGMSGD